MGEGGIRLPTDPDQLDSSVYLFVVEDDIMAWSSVEDKEVMTHNVFRETALHNAQVELLPGETWSNEVEWIIPETIMYPSGHEDHDGNAQEGEHPILTPINPAKISVVAVVYDNDDTSRTTSSGKPVMQQIPQELLIQQLLNQLHMTSKTSLQKLLVMMKN